MPRNAPYRPQFHYTAERGWLNDPNGLVWLDGEYHLFYQFNPFGEQWGHMSWGHAVSADLLHWTELPVAIPEDARASVFSGSVVVDTHNLSGFGDGQQPALVAIYTACLRRPKVARCRKLLTAPTAAATGHGTPATPCWTWASATSATPRSSGTRPPNAG